MDGHNEDGERTPDYICWLHRPQSPFGMLFDRRKVLVFYNDPTVKLKTMFFQYAAKLAPYTKELWKYRVYHQLGGIRAAVTHEGELLVVGYRFGEPRLFAFTTVSAKQGLSTKRLEELDLLASLNTFATD